MDPTPEARRPDSPSISFVLPAYNEERNVAAAVEQALEVAARWCSAYEVIVVDDGSSDGTAAAVRRLGTSSDAVRLVQHDRNRGYGEALRTGFLAATCDYVFFTDADNQFDMNELSLLLPWIGHVDVIAGYRRNRQDRALRRLYAWAWNRLVRVLFYVPVRDIDCAFKLFRRSILEDLEIESMGAMVNTEVMVKLGRTGKTVVEIGVTHYPRTAGKARGAHPKVIIRALLELSRMYRRLAHLGPGDPPVPPSQFDR